MIYIFGHKKPDTDSVTSAIALSYLKNQIGMETEPRILGKINDETKFVLNHFNVEVPKILEDVKLKIKDIYYYKNYYGYTDNSLYEVYNYMINHNITGLPILSVDKKFVGLITSKMIINDMIKDNFDTINTTYNNILELLNGVSLLNFDEQIKGIIDNDIFIVDSISEFRNKMIKKPKLIIIANNSKLDLEDYKK